MNAFPVLPLVGTAVFLVACAILAARMLRLRRTGDFHSEHGFFLAALVMAALAPVAWLLVVRFVDDPSFWSGGVQLLVSALLVAAGINARRQRLDPERASTMSYHEKSAIVVLAALVLVCIQFLTRIWQASASDALPLFVAAVALLVATMIVGHLVLALFHGPTRELNNRIDERDRDIRLRSARNAYFTMMFFFWAIPVLALMGFPALQIAKVSLAVLLAGEFAYYGSTLAYYRLGTP